MGLKVLLVEDEALVAMLIEDLLSDLGHVVVGTASRVEAATLAAREMEFELAILDVNLHGAKTYEIAELIAKRGIPLIFATGYGAHGIEDPWRDTPILQKPFELDSLAAAIDRAVPAR